MSNGQFFVLGIIAISTLGWLASSWIRARHGYPIENEWSGKSHRGDPDAERKIALLNSENETLTGKVGRLEERIAVLERIATDQPNRLSAEIENLR
jgi:hypothetical protein